MRARLALLLLGAAALIAARPPMRVQPNPSAVIAAEIRFNRLAQTRGQWTAYREFAAKDAMLFAPQQVVARDWLKGRADPAEPMRWSPATVYVSCNGRLAASQGTVRYADGSPGYVTTIWRLDDKGEWRWIMRQDGAWAEAPAQDQPMQGKIATCVRTDDAPSTPPASGKRAAPVDQSLLWSAQGAPDGRPTLTVRMWTGTEYETVIDGSGEAGRR